MQNVQRFLLALFMLFAALTAFLQLRYGMLCGRAQTENKQDDPKIKTCQRYATFCAIVAAISLIACGVLGAVTLRG